jgi:hypothetical protein
MQEMCSRLLPVSCRSCARRLVLSMCLQYRVPPLLALTPAGITLGMATVRWFASKYEHYNWQGISELDSLSAKVRCGAGVVWGQIAVGQGGQRWGTLQARGRQPPKLCSLSAQVWDGLRCGSASRAARHWPLRAPQLGPALRLPLAVPSRLHARPCHPPPGAAVDGAAAALLVDAPGVDGVFE